MSGKTSPSADNDGADQANNLNPREQDYINAKSYLLTDSEKSHANV